MGISSLLAPSLSGVMVTTGGLKLVMLVDLITCIIAELSVLFLHFPSSVQGNLYSTLFYLLNKFEEEKKEKTKWIHEIGQGWACIIRQIPTCTKTSQHDQLRYKVPPSINRLNACFYDRQLHHPLYYGADTSSMNFSFFSVDTYQRFSLQLSLTISSAEIFGYMSTITGCGFLVGSVCVSIWGTPKPYGKTIFILLGVQGNTRENEKILLIPISGAIMTTGRMKPTVEIITITGFIYMFLAPFISGCSTAIWY